MGRQRAEEKAKPLLYKNNSRYEPQVFCNLFDGWMQARRDGDERQRERCINEIYDYLKDFIYYTLWRYFPQQMANREEREGLINDMWKQIMSVLPGYDYRKARITTYLAPYFHAAGRDCMGRIYHTTGYYTDIRGKVEKAVNFLQMKGDEPETETLMRLTGLSKKVVEQTLEKKKFEETDSLEANVEKIDSLHSSEEGVPERIILRWDLEEMFGRFLKKLSAEEEIVMKAVLTMEVDTQDELNCKNITRYVKEIAQKDRFLCGKKFYPEKVRKIMNRIGEKLLSDEEVGDYLCEYFCRQI